MKKVIKAKFGGDATLIGDEGGFTPPCYVELGLEMLMDTSKAAGYLDKVSIGLDIASLEFKVTNKDVHDLEFKALDTEICWSESPHS